MTSILQENNSACFNGHLIANKIRTDDIKCLEELTFDDLLLSPTVLKGLKASGFNRPSPIQVKAIPLGRFGMDLVIQAKSGTGKTCVFSVIALEALSPNSSALQVLILSPTREIAFQSQQVINTIGAQIDKLKCHTFIGGIHLSEDLRLVKECQIAVGSPGRIKFLIESGYMKTDNIRLFVLDEADMLFTDNFQPTINWIYSTLPSSKQMLTLSATYTSDMINHLSRYMRSPSYIRLNSSDPALLGIRQFFATVPYNSSKNAVFKSKTEILFKLLSTVEFQQCLVFSNYHSSAQDLCESLTENGWPAAYIASSLDQAQRLKVYEKLKRFHCRILVSTDLTSRGIDAENVNLVVNMEVPWEHETYLHRMGRAGRFGAYGVALTLVTEGDEFSLLDKIQAQCGTKIHQLPDSIPSDLTRPECQLNVEDLLTTEQLIIPQSTQPDQLPSSSFTQIINKATKKQTKNNHSKKKRHRDHHPDDQSHSIPLHKSELLIGAANSTPNYESDQGTFNQTKPLNKISKRKEEAIKRKSEITEFINELWRPLDQKLNRFMDKEVSTLAMKELLSRYKTDGISVFSTNSNAEHLLMNSLPPLAIPEVLKQSTLLIQSKHILDTQESDHDEEEDEEEEEEANDVSEKINNNDEKWPICFDAANQTTPVEDSFTAPQRTDSHETYRLQELDAEFWRLHSWANYYSSRYNEWTNVIEVTKAKMDLLYQCDIYQNEYDKEEDAVTGGSSDFPDDLFETTDV